MRRTPATIGVLIAIGIVAWIALSSRASSGPAIGDPEMGESGSPEAGASDNDRSIDSPGGLSRRPVWVPAALRAKAGAQVEVSAGVHRIARIVVANERGEPVEGLTVRRITDPSSPVMEGLGEPNRRHELSAYRRRILLSHHGSLLRHPPV